MRHILWWLGLSLLVTGCVTRVDDRLPVAHLPEITTSISFNLVASPSHPTSYLTTEQLPGNARVQIIGTEPNAQYLLVIYEELIGWMPAFYSMNGVAMLEPALTIDPLSPECATYLGTTSDVHDRWTSTAHGQIVIQGTILRSTALVDFEDTSLQVVLRGKGEVTAAEYLHLPLTDALNLVLYSFAIDDVERGDQVEFVLDADSSNAATFQAAYYLDPCHSWAEYRGVYTDTLPVGNVKVQLPTPQPTDTRETPRTDSTRSPTAGSTSVPGPTVVVTSGVPLRAPTQRELLDLIRRWDEIHHEVDNTLEPDGLDTVLTGGALASQLETLETLRKYSCYWDFVSLSDPVILEIDEISVSEVFVRARKDWDGRQYCNGRRSATINEPFEVRYQVVRTNKGWRIAEKVPLDYEVPLPRATLTPRPRATNTSHQPNDSLRNAILAKSSRSPVRMDHSRARDLFVTNLTQNLWRFQLSREGITEQTMRSALGNADIGDRINGAVQEIWGEWLGITEGQGVDPFRTDPENQGLSPFRQLIIRMIQGRQGSLSAAQQRALYSYFIRYERRDVWSNNMDGVIGAINREQF